MDSPPGHKSAGTGLLSNEAKEHPSRPKEAARPEPKRGKAAKRRLAGPVQREMKKGVSQIMSSCSKKRDDTRSKFGHHEASRARQSLVAGTDIGKKMPKGVKKSRS